MWAWSYIHVLLLISSNIYNASCEGKSSLTFVIDNTGSMYDDIWQVKKNADGITKIVFDEKASQIKNMVLVTFNDPDTELVTPTEDRDVFKTSINRVRVYGGGDCPEMSMKGIIQALDASLPGSFIYVFTDAAAADYTRGREVQNLCQKKQSQIVFVLTGFCESPNDPNYQVYYNIAAACSGLTFLVHKSQVDQILDTIKETIIGNKTVLTTKKVPAYISSNIDFTIDDQTEYAIVTASGFEVELSVTGPKADTEYLTWLQNAKVIKLNRPVPGIYTATVRGNSETSVYVVGRSDFTFTHGFSELEPKSLKDTTPQPIADTPTLLSISVTDPKHTVEILLVHILNMDEQIINSILLRKISNDFYTTTIPFKAPSERFKIAVIGQEARTRKHIRRLAKLPITPQEPPKVELKPLKPEITISEGKAIQVEYGQTVKLTCKVKAYPEPKIEWVKGRKTLMKSQSSAVEPPYEYISYLTIEDAAENDRYSCRAKNDAGLDITNIDVTVKEPFVIKSAIYGITEIKYGTKGTLRCDITAPLAMHITWNYIDEHTGVRKEITHTSKEYSLSADGTVLTINKMDLNLIGTYICKATLDKFKNKTSVHKTRVKVSGLAPPTATGVNNMNASVGSNVDIKCRVTGVPEPTVTWLFKAKGDTKFIPLLESKIAVVHISSVNLDHEGSYKCIARNVMSESEHLTTLTVQVPPNIVSSSSDVYKSIEGRDARLQIPCNATGRPKPIITWTVNGVTVSDSAKYSIKDGALVIRAPKTSDSHRYKCEAKNGAGSTHAWFQVEIYQMPKISGEATKKIIMEKPVNIICKIIKGVPKPKITWYFMSEGSSELILLPESNEVLRISSAHRNQAGTYKCIASNVVGKDEHLTVLTVEFAPIILSDDSTIKGVEGDIALHIPCKTIGVPKPSVTWKMNGDIITTNAHYLITDGALIIKEPKKNDSNSYTCEAKNYLGLQHATLKAKITKYIEEFGPKEIVNIKRGETINLDCGSNDPSQSIRWYMEGVEQGIKGNFFQLKNVNVNLDGNYTCRVSGINGTYTKTLVVFVGYPPTFTSEQGEPLLDWSGKADDTLNCDVEAKPSPDIIWTYNGKVLRDKTSQLSVSGNWGQYTCKVKNVHGEVQRNFDVTSSQCLIRRQPENLKTMPLVLTPTATWPVLNSTTDYLKIDAGKAVMFSCPNVKDKKNAFQKFPGINVTMATCEKQDIFKVEGMPYKTSDLQCVQEGSFIVDERHQKCLTENSELVRVGYEVDGFLETYEVCLDISTKVPLYTRAMMSISNQGLGAVYKWYKYPGFVDGNKEAIYNCGHLKSTCCYSKTQLVNARDFSDGPAQRSTFVDNLNAVPYWRPCDLEQSPWETIEDMIRSRFSIYDQFIVWSGTHMLQRKNGGVVPRYLWKVAKFDDEESIAIVYVNDPSPSAADVLCKNICANEGSISWINVQNKYMYCCTVDDFLAAFNLLNSGLEEPMSSALEKIMSKKY